MSKELILPIHSQILNHLEQAIIFVHQSGRIIKGNPSALSLLNINHLDLSQLSMNDFLNINLLFAKDETHMLMKLKNYQGSLIDVKSIKVDEKVYCLLMKEVSLEDKTFEVKQHIDRLVEVSSEGLIMFSEDKIIDCDLEFATMFGYTKQEIRNMKLEDLFDHQSLRELENIHKYPGKSHELTGIRKNGTTFHIELTDHPYINKEIIIRIAIIKDISERIEHEKRLEYMAYFDELTDLPNRNYFIKVLKDALAEAKNTNESLAVYFIDLDYFKEINETLGYDFGDKLLTASGKRLKKFKDTDTFVARASGDEFLILQRHMTKDHPPTDLAKNLIDVFEDPVVIEGY